MATKDFRAKQVETSKIIGTGSIAGTEVGIAIYSGSIANNRMGGTTDSAMFSKVGTDVFLFVSGTQGGRGTFGTSVFGGDLISSGTIVKVDSINGSLVAEIGNTGLVLSSLKVAEFGNSSSKILGDISNNLNVSGSNDLRLYANDYIVLNAADSQFRYYESNTEFFRITNSSNDAVLQPMQSNKDIIFKEDGGDEVFRVDSSAKDILMAAGNNVSFGASTRFIGDGTDYNSDATAVVIAGSNDIVIGPGSDSQAFMSLGANGQFVVADGDGPTNYLMITGSFLGGILSSSVHNKNVSIHCNNAQESFSITGTGTAIFNDPGPLGADTSFTVSGSKGSRGTSKRGTSVFGGDVFISGSTHIATGSVEQGLFLRSPDGSVFRLNVDNSGNLTTSKET